MHNYVYILVDMQVLGRVVNGGLKCFFSMYWPSCFIEAFVRPEKYLLMCIGLLANHLFSSNIIFLSSSFLAAAECVTCFVDLDRR
jgi:hypothetical protein